MVLLCQLDGRGQWILLAFTFISSCLFEPVMTSTYYFDKYGHCASTDPIVIDDEQHTILAKGGEAYSTLQCDLSFKADRNDQLCLHFITYSVDNCDVELFVYDKDASSGSYMNKFTCGSDVHSVCSSGRYLTLLLKKRRLSSKQYNFELVVREKSESDVFMDGLDAFVLSIGLIIGIIVGVVCLIAVLAVIVVCCCCKRKASQGRVYRKAPKAASEGEPFQRNVNHHPVQPSAPPLQESNLPPPSAMILPHDIHQGYAQPFPLEPPPAYTPVPPLESQAPAIVKT
ncbi:uncharacterized protein LOC110459596 [Mizuhopecten yessoensis]|uniref:CUB domain-containing protein n=1 Tax=Mizuhopecten yessoensis TaxID=6573 RepID=A0A210Q469_MIZYE|nr:uncharacterized protein LOC110459596 [Mizuhopecten yessoensis]OWF43536.1 hypothetical protein KP79_PYT10226 [Mizuhopecten yessoensis]